jgi:hypothetical protein
MSAVTPINLTAYGFTTPAGPKTAATESGGAGHIEGCYVACGLTGTYVQGTGLSITSAQLATAISTAKRDGQTITILDVATAAPGIEIISSVNTFVDAGPVTFTTTAGPATALLYGPDEATEHAAAAMGVFVSPLVFFVKFAAQANL